MDSQIVLKALGQLELSSDEIVALRAFLATGIHPGEYLSLIESAAGRRPCPHYACSRCHRSGMASGLQRYRCTIVSRSVVYEDVARVGVQEGSLRAAIVILEVMLGLRRP